MGGLGKWALIGVAVVAAGGPTLFVALQPIQVLPRMSLAPGFGLTDPTGEPVTSDAFKGGFTLYGFDYAGCGETCADTRSLFRELQDRLDVTGGLLGQVPVRLVTVGLDPAGDSRDGLAALADSLAASPGRWTVAGGDSADVVRTVRDGFGFWYEAEEDGGFRFDPRVVLVDQFGIRRREYEYGGFDPETVMADLGRLEQESRAEGMTHLAYEAAHLFACYSY